MSNRFNQQDILAKDKLEVSSFMIYKKAYRELSNDAKFMYQYLIKRFSLTEHYFEKAIEEDTMADFTFVDEKGELFCYVSNDELKFVLNISEPTVKKCKEQLAKVGLLEEVKQTAHKTNRLYVNKVEMETSDKSSFHKELKEYKTTEYEKRKVKNRKRKEKKSEVKPAEKPATKTTENPPKSYPQTPVDNTPGSEPKKFRFSEPKNIGFMNQRILGLSTKELKSTKELVSTKESVINQSVYIDDTLNSIPDEVVPMVVKKQISINKKRLIDDNIDPLDIFVFFKSGENTLGHYDFAMILSNVLKKTKGKIISFHAVMKKAIENYYVEYKAELMPNLLEQLNEYEEDEKALGNTWDGNFRSHPE